MHVKYLNWITRDMLRAEPEATFVFGDNAQRVGMGGQDCHYSGEWPDGGWWVSDGGDLWPSRPVMYRKRPAQGASGSAQDAQRLDPQGAGPTPSGDAP